MILDPSLNTRLGAALKAAWGRVPLSWKLSRDDYTRVLRSQDRYSRPDQVDVKLPMSARPLLGLPVELAMGTTSTLVVQERTSDERAEISV